MIPPERIRRNDAAVLRHDPYARDPAYVVRTTRLPELPDDSVTPRAPAGRAGERWQPGISLEPTGSPPATPRRIRHISLNTLPRAEFVPKPPGRRPTPPLWARCCAACSLLLLFLIFALGVGYSVWGVKKLLFNNEDGPYVFDNPVHHKTEQASSYFGKSSSSYESPVQSESSSSYDESPETSTSPIQKVTKGSLFTQWSDRTKSKTSTQRESEAKKSEALKKMTSIFSEKPLESQESTIQKVTSIFSDKSSKGSQYEPTGPESPPPGPSIPKPPITNQLPTSLLSSCRNPTLPLQIASALPPGSGLTTFPIDGLIMSSPNDIFAHLINTGLLLYRSPIYNLPLIRTGLVPKAFALQGLMDAQTNVHNGKRTPEADGVFKSLNLFINSLPGTKNGAKIQVHDSALSHDLGELAVKMKTVAKGGSIGKSWWGIYSGGDVYEELRSEYLRTLKRQYEAVRYYHPLVTRSIENHKKFLDARKVYLKRLGELDPRNAPEDSEIEALDQLKEDYNLSRKGLHEFWEVTGGMMVGLRDWERRLREVLDEEKKVIKRLSKKSEGGGRKLECDILSLGHLIGWVQHSFMVERRYNEGYF